MPDHHAHKPTPWRDEETLQELYGEQGLSLKEIADELGCSIGTASNWVNKYGIDRYEPEEITPWRDKETLEYLFYERGYTRQEIADRFGIWYRTVNRWLRKHDLQPETPSRKFGRLENTANGYVQFVDYCGPGDERRVYIHRLLACVDHSLDELKGNHVHHRIPDPWLNYRENIEVLTPYEHHSCHATGEFDRGNAY